MPTTPRSSEAIHLLRALYRQASCFFDEQARDYLRTQIRARFQKCQHVALEHRQSRLLKHGRKVLSTIQRANLGDIKRAVKILKYTHGQAGPRRHELLAPIVESEPGIPLIPGDRRTAKPIMSPALRALIHASRRRTFREQEPDIPETNRWNRPFPLRREANLSWRYHSRIIKRLPVPIPDNELEKLDRFSMGVDESIPPKRRRVVQQPYIKEDYGETRNVTARVKRRIYQKLLEEIPILKYQNSRYSVKFRDMKMQLNDGSTIMDEFEGLDVKGRFIEPESSRDKKVIGSQHANGFSVESRGDDKSTEEDVLDYTRLL